MGLETVDMMSPVCQPVSNSADVSANIKNNVVFGQQRLNNVQPICCINRQVFVKCPLKPLTLQDWTQQTTLWIVNVNYQLGFFEPTLDDWLRDVL